MTQEEYKVFQKDNIERAIATGQKLLQISASLHQVCDTADTDEKRNDEEKNFVRDSLMYYDFNDIAKDIAIMPAIVNEFKLKLIDIKIANDRMLFEGGFIPEMDEKIANVFTSHVLCKIQIIDEKILGAVQDALAMLEDLKKYL